MGSSKKQTVGYKYFAGLMVVIGNRIEKLININPDNRGWIIDRQKYLIDAPLEVTNHTKEIHKPNLFGGDKQEGGWVGLLDHHMGMNDQEPSEYLRAQIGDDVSAYPNLSYLVFRGFNETTYTNPVTHETTVELDPSLDRGFQLVSMSGMMKDFLLWPKRTQIRNDGREQWYKINAQNEIVCEIDARTDAIIAYEKQLENLPPIENQWFGTDNDPSQPGFHAFSTAGLINGYVWNFHSQFGGDIKTGYIKTTFPDFIVGLKLKLELWGDDDITSFSWTGGGYKVIREFSEPGFITCKEYLLDCESPPFHLKAGITDGVLGGSSLNHKVNIFSELAPASQNGVNSGVDINPIHKIREILTDDIAMGRPESEINDINFKAAADRIYDEGLGISWALTEKSCKEALDELCNHIEAGLRVNRQTGLFEVILFRDDLLNLDTAILFNKGNVKSFNAEVVNADDMINVVNVSYYDRELIKDSSFSLYDNGLIQTIGYENAEKLDFPYFMQRYNAEKVANWKLKQLSTPAWKGSFSTGIYDARLLNRYDVIKITWPEYQIDNMAVRITKIDLGDGLDNTVTIEWVEVVAYSSAGYASINVDNSKQSDTNAQPNINTVFEMPYLEVVQRNGQLQVDQELALNPEIGYLMAAAIKPQNNSINALIYTDQGTGNYTDFEQVAIMDYCKGAYLDGAIGYLDTTFAIKATDFDKAINLSGVRSGAWLQLNAELMVFISYDSDTRLITVKRGALDTVPQTHDSGVLFFWDDNAGADTTAYASGEVVAAQVLTTTPNSILPLAPGASVTLNIVGRAARPYPPANVKINDEYYPADCDGMVLTWNHRNRLQQTGGDLLGWTDAGVTLETGVTYHLSVYEINQDDAESELFNANVGAVDSYTVDLSGTDSGTRKYRILLKSVRSDIESYQHFEHILSTAFSAPYNLTAEYVA